MDFGANQNQHKNHPIFFDQHNYVNCSDYLRSDNTTHFANSGKQTSFCAVCDQHFRTPVIYNRHMRSRKHALKYLRATMDKPRSKTNEHLSLLPNEVIDSLICDLKESLDEKDSFFGDIDDSSAEQTQSLLLPSFGNVFVDHGDNGTGSASTQQPHNLNANVPKIYPCSWCFRSLHSQELFDQHLREKHFRGCEPIY